jgi:hypothetical protein
MIIIEKRHFAKEYEGKHTRIARMWCMLFWSNKKATPSVLFYMSSLQKSRVFGKIVGVIKLSQICVFISTRLLLIKYIFIVNFSYTKANW